MGTAIIMSAIIWGAILMGAMAESNELTVTMITQMRQEVDDIKDQMRQLQEVGAMKDQLNMMHNSQEENKDSVMTLRHDMALQKNELDHLRSLVQKQDEELSLTRKALLAAQELFNTAIGSGRRFLQTDPNATESSAPPRYNESECLSPGDIAHQALNQTYSVGQALLRIINENAIDAPHSYALPATFARTAQLEDKADTVHLLAVEHDLIELTHQFRETGIADSAPERGTCLCAVCADQPPGGMLCEPWQNYSTPCDCIPDEFSTGALTRQAWDTVNQQQPPCCRPEWLSHVAATQMELDGQSAYSLDAEVLSQPGDQVVLKVGADVTLHYGAYENVVQTDCDDWRMIPGGLQSQPPSENGGTFSHWFSATWLAEDPTRSLHEPGEFCFRSFNSMSLRIKIVVMDCEYCEVIHGYDGSELRSLARALESRAPGNYSLHARNFATDGVMTYLNVYDRQSVAITGRTLASNDQLTTLDAMIHIFAGGMLSLDAVYVSSHITKEAGGFLDDQTGRLVQDHLGLALPLAQDELPECSQGMRSDNVVVLRRPELDQDSLMVCSVMNGEANWREVQTMGGVTYDGTHIASFLSALQSGLPGKYVLRLTGVGTTYAVEHLSLRPYQEARIIATATMGSSLKLGEISLSEESKFAIVGGSSMLAFQEPGDVDSSATIAFEGQVDTADGSAILISCDVAALSFQHAVKVARGSNLLIRGEIGFLEFPGGVVIDEGAEIDIQSAQDSSIQISVIALWHFIDSASTRGAVAISDAAIVALDGDMIGRVEGYLPGDLKVNATDVSTDTVTTGIITRHANGTVNVPTALTSTLGWVFNENDIDEFLWTVHAGRAGLYGLHLTVSEAQYVIPRIQIFTGQDVYVSLLAEGSSCHFMGGVSVQAHGSLTVSGRFSTLRFSNATTVDDYAKLFIRPNEHEGLIPSENSAVGDVIFADIDVRDNSELLLTGTARVVLFEREVAVSMQSWLSIRVVASEVAFTDVVQVVNASGLSVAGSISWFTVPRGVYVAEGCTMSILSDHDRSIHVALGTVWQSVDLAHNQGSFTWHSVALLGVDRSEVGVITDGSLPGQLQVVLDADQQNGTVTQYRGIVSRSHDDTAVVVPDPLRSVMGQVFTRENLDAFLTRVRSGSTGFIGLRLCDSYEVVDLGQIWVHNGQDVRIFCETTTSAQLSFMAAKVSTGGQLMITGTFELVDFTLVAIAWTPANNGTVHFAGGVTAVLPDGTAPVLNGMLPGTLVAELDGSAVVEVVRDHTSSTFSPAGWGVVQCFGQESVDEFAAASSAGEAGLIILHAYSTSQDLTLSGLGVSAQDVRVISSGERIALAFTDEVQAVSGAQLWLAGVMDVVFEGAVDVEPGSTLRMTGNVALSDTAWLGYGKDPDTLRGRWVAEGEVTVPRATDDVPLTLAGELPGTMVATLDGDTVGTVTRTHAGVDTATGGDGWLHVVVKMKAWGAGGGGGERHTYNGWGGAGGYAEAEYLAVSGDTLSVTVGYRGTRGRTGGSTPDGGFPNGGWAGEWSYAGGGGGGASFVRGYTVSTRAQTGVVLGAGGGGGGGGNDCNAGNGGGGGGTANGHIGQGGYGGTSSSGSQGTNGGGRGGWNEDAKGQSQNGAGGNFGCTNGGGGGGGAASSMNVLPGTYRTIDAVDSGPINDGDLHYSASNSGAGGAEDHHGLPGRVVIIVGGVATIFDDTYTSTTHTYSTSLINSQSHDFVVH